MPKLIPSASFAADYGALPLPIRKITQKKLALFAANYRHASLRAKKMEGPGDIWQARITKNYRFTFQLEGDVCILRRIGTP